MALPKVGETISAEEFSKLPKVGETISAEQFSRLETKPQAGIDIGEQKPELLEGNENILVKIGKFLGLKPLGEAIGRGIFRFTPESRELNRMVQTKQVPSREAVIGEAPTAGQFAGSTLQLGAALVGGPAFKAAQGLRGAIKAGAGLGSLAGVGKGLEEKSSIPEIAQQALVGGLLGGAIPVAGAMIKKGFELGTKILPERLQSVIFKTAEEDLRAAYRTAADGVEPNPTLARETIEEGIFGNSRNMAIYSFNKLDDLESQVQGFVKNPKKLISVPDKKGYVNFLKTVKDTFKGGFEIETERAKNADLLLKELQKAKGGNVQIGTALKLRRFIDAMRNTSSFRTDQALNARQDIFRTAANGLRKKLADAGLGELMKKERIFIQALDSIVEDAVKRQNKNVIGLVDLLAGGGGLVSGGPLGGISGAVAIRGFQNPFTLTTLAQGLFRGGRFLERGTEKISQKLPAGTGNIARALQVLGVKEATSP